MGQCFAEPFFPELQVKVRSLVTSLAVYWYLSTCWEHAQS